MRKDVPSILFSAIILFAIIIFVIRSNLCYSHHIDTALLQLLLIHSARGATDIIWNIYKHNNSTPAVTELKNDKIPSLYTLLWRVKERI
jgi:hypothetical protein